MCLSVWLHPVQLLVGRGLVLTSKAQERLEGGHWRPPAVEAKGEFVEIGLKVSVANAVMRAPKPGLEVPEHPVNAGEDLARPLRVALRAGSVAVSQLGEGVVSPPSVGEHD